MKVRQRNLESLKPYGKNPRRIPEVAIAKVRTSLEEFGAQQPIVVDAEMVIIVGHTRWQAAKELGWKTFPTVVAEGLSRSQARAYRIMDNRSHEETDWDYDSLRFELGELTDLDLNLTGFDATEISGLFSEVAGPKEFPEYDKDIETSLSCPKCGYKWSE